MRLLQGLRQMVEALEQLPMPLGYFRLILRCFGDTPERRAAILAQLGQIRDIVGGVASDTDEPEAEVEVAEAEEVDEPADVEPTVDVEEVPVVEDVEEIEDSEDDLDAEAAQLMDFEDLDPRSKR